MSNVDKAKEFSSGLFNKTKKELFRAKQKIAVKMGKSEETIDITFNQETERIVETKKIIKTANKDAAKLLDLMKQLCVAQAALAEDFYSLYEASAPLYNAVTKNQDIVKLIDAARVQFDEQMKADFTDPVSKYIGQFKDIKARIVVRDTRKIDMDRYAKEVKNYQEKAKTDKLDPAVHKLEVAKSNYTSLNNELLHDMPALFEDRIPFFDPIIATYVTGMAEFYRQAAKASSEILGMVSHIDRASVHDHPRVVTSPESSSATHTQTTTGTTITASAPSEKPKTEISSAPMPVAHPKPSAPASTKQAKALFEFNAQDSTELGFKVNDIITILSTNGEWWEGELHGKRGLLPSNYVQFI